MKVAKPFKFLTFGVQMEIFAVIIPARNAASTLERSVRSAWDALPSQSRLLIVENGSVDDTLLVARRLSATLKGVSVLQSNPGKIQALLTGISSLPERKPFACIDADVIVDPPAFGILLNELEQHPALMAVGGNPRLPGEYSVDSPLAYLNLSALFPESKVVVDTSYGFAEASRYPQPNMDPQREVRLKPCFHGRIYCIRHKGCIPDTAPRRNLGDDDYWGRHIIHTYGPGSIRNRYDAVAVFEPRKTPEESIAYRGRIAHQIRVLEEEYPEFEYLTDAFQTYRDSEYISKLPPNIMRLFEAERLMDQTAGKKQDDFPWHGTII